VSQLPTQTLSLLLRVLVPDHFTQADLRPNPVIQVLEDSEFLSVLVARTSFCGRFGLCFFLFVVGGNSSSVGFFPVSGLAVFSALLCSLGVETP